MGGRQPRRHVCCSAEARRMSSTVPAAVLSPSRRAWCRRRMRLRGRAPEPGCKTGRGPLPAEKPGTSAKRSKGKLVTPTLRSGARSGIMRAQAQPVRLSRGLSPAAERRGRVGSSRSPSPSPSSPGLKASQPCRRDASRRDVVMAASARSPSPSPAGPNGDRFIAQRTRGGKPAQSLAQQFTGPSEDSATSVAVPASPGVIVTANQIQLTILVLVVFLSAAASAAVLPLYARLHPLPFLFTSSHLSPVPPKRTSSPHLACSGSRTSRPGLDCRILQPRSWRSHRLPSRSRPLHRVSWRESWLENPP